MTREECKKAADRMRLEDMERREYLKAQKKYREKYGRKSDGQRSEHEAEGGDGSFA